MKMHTDIFLEHREIVSLTGRIKRPAQIKVLLSMGIEHRVRPDGTVAILRDHISKIFDGNPESSQEKAQSAIPNWAAM